MKDRLSSILKNEGVPFYEICNPEGKRWLIPHKNSAIGLLIYQPSSWKGKWLKQLFFIIKYSQFARRMLKIRKTGYSLHSPLQAELQTIFNTANLDFSVFMGTPSVHQKITLQIANGSQILGYCKITDRDMVKPLFAHEALILKTLNSCGLTSVPACLKQGTWANGFSLFVQSTQKTIDSKIIYTITPVHLAFLKKLHTATVTTLPYVHTDFYKSLVLLQQQLESMQDQKIKLVLRKIKETHQWFDQNDVDFSMYHGDFTPWNMVVEKKELFVFDWEYAQRTYPPYIDVFHFFTQTAIHKHNWDAQRIFEDFKQNYMTYEAIFEHPVASYKHYLLAVIALFLLREDQAWNEQKILDIAEIWIDLLYYLETYEA